MIILLSQIMDGEDPVLQVQVQVWFFLINLKNSPLPPFERVAIDVPKFFNDPYAEGNIVLEDLVISGLDSIGISMDGILDTVNVTQDDETLPLFKICVHFPVEKIDISMKYTVDIGWNNSVPIYGEGDLSFSITNIKMDLCTMANISAGYAYNMQLYMTYRYEPVTLTGFYKNPEVNDIASRILNIANSLFTMWTNYDPIGASCILSPIFETVVNAFVNYPDVTLKFDPACLQGLHWIY